MRMPRYALFAAALAAGGLPIYIHAPRVFAEQHGVTLATVGLVLVALRAIDVVQDPLLGRLAGRLRDRRGIAAVIASVGLAAGMLGLFAVTPPFEPIVWLSLCLVLLFSCFSFLTIMFYARGVGEGQSGGARGHERVATWREVGALCGICLASAAPALFGAMGAPDPYLLFAIFFAVLAIVASFGMLRLWSGDIAPERPGFRAATQDAALRRLLLIGFFNAAPVAVTATLFLFFVEDRLGAGEMAGPLLLAFFIAAAVAAPVWTRAAARFGTERVLMFSMIVSILAFSWAYVLNAGDVVPFLIICLVSGAALGADMTLLPALLSARIAETGANGSEVFGLWNFCSKLTLAIAAATVLPLLGAAGYVSGSDNNPAALSRLSLLYGLVPCVLKLIALILLSLRSRKVLAPC